MPYDDDEAAAIAKIIVDTFVDVFGRRPCDEDEVAAFLRSCLRLEIMADARVLTAQFRQHHGRHPRDTGEWIEWIDEKTTVRH